MTVTDIAAISGEALGWLFPDEGPALYDAAMSAPQGPFVEIGSYCGKSTVWLGAAARERDTVVFSVDHHRGSPEMQPGMENHNPAVAEDGRHDTLFHFRSTIGTAGLEAFVVAMVADSLTAARYWRTPVGLLFIDATHYYEPVHNDFLAWAGWVVPSGILAFHDVTIPAVDKVAKEAVDAGFEFVGEVDTLRILRRGAVL